MEMTKVVKPFIRRGRPNTFSNRVCVCMCVCVCLYFSDDLIMMHVLFNKQCWVGNIFNAILFTNVAIYKSLMQKKKNKLGLNLFHHTRKYIALFAVYML